MTNRKPFSQELFDSNDTPASAKLKELFQGTLFSIRKPQDKYAVDFELYKDNILVAYIETEVKNGWDGHRYPFEDVRFPERKRKFCSLGKPVYFVMFNKDLSRHLVVRDKVLVKSPVVTIDNKYVRKEAFFAVALSSVEFDKLNRLVKAAV